MATINRDIKLKDLNGDGIISVRTFNALSYFRMKTIGDVVDYMNKGNNLRNIKNLGLKSELEILNYLAMNSVGNDDNITNTKVSNLIAVPQGELDIFANCVKSTKCSSDNIHSYIEKAYENINVFHEWIFNCKNGLIPVVTSLNKGENVLFREFIITILEEYIKNINDIEFRSFVNTAKEAMQENLNVFSYEDNYIFATETCKSYISTEFQKLYTTRLNTRAFNFIEKNGITPISLIKLFDKLLPEYNVLCPGSSNKKTLSEIFAFNQIFKKRVDEIINLTDTEIRELQLKAEYPYLSCQQRSFVKSFKNEHGYRPVLFLLYNFLRISEDRADKLYSLFHGVFDEVSHSLEEIANAYEITRERVRQIVYGSIPAAKSINITDKEKRYYALTFSDFILTEEDSKLSFQMELEHLNCSFHVVGALLRLLNSKLDFFSPYKSVECLFNEHSLDRQLLKSCLALLENVAKGKYSRDTELNLNDIVNCVDNDVRPHILQFLSYVALAEFGIEIDVKGNFTMSQNCVDIESEMYDLLLLHNKPLHLEELFVLFKNKYPNHKYTEASQLRPYVLGNDKIGAIGKTSTYALKERSDIFFGSIRDLLYSILNDSNEPLSIDAIMEKVKAIYPKTSQSSIESTMQSDTYDRFVAFEDNYYGLCNKRYDRELKALRVIRKMTFEERFTKYVEFVELYHRLPSNGSSNDEEASLGRWKGNVETGVVSVSEEQRKSFDDMLKDYLEKGYPRTITESEFFNRCIEYRRFIYNNHNLPTLKNGKELYEWIRRSLSNYDGYADQRYQYFTDLLEFIHSLGFELSRSKSNE